MKRRTFIQSTGALTAGAIITSCAGAPSTTSAVKERIRTAHIGVGNMGMEDLKAISSHAKVDVTALCDVDANYLKAAQEMFPKAKVYRDYRTMLKEMGEEIDAVVVSTPDHTHAPASMMAMEMDKAVYCQKPLTHHVTEARAMRKIAKEKNLSLGELQELIGEIESELKEKDNNE